MQCSTCGSPLDPGAAFCGVCGATVVAAQAPQYGNPAYGQQVGYTASPMPGVMPTGSDPAKRIFNLAPTLTHALDHGSIFKVAVSWFIRIWAVLLTICIWISGIAAFLGGIFSFEYGALWGIFGFIGGVMCAALAVFFGWTVLKLMWLRADKAHSLKSGELTALPLFSLLVKLNGEVGALVLTYWGLFFAILSIFAQVSITGGAMSLMSFGFGNFWGSPEWSIAVAASGVAALIGSVLGGFLLLFVAYYLAEAIEAMANIARDASGIRRMLATRGGEQD